MSTASRLTDRWPVRLALAALAGLTLFAADYPLRWWPLGAVALVPMLLVALAPRCRARDVALAAIVFGLAYHVPLLLVLEFPLALGGALGLVLTALWMVTWMGAHALRRRAPLAAALGTAALAALIEWASTELVPVWGTAQSFVRTWSAAPWAMQSVALWGMTGLVFVVVLVQTLAAQTILGQGRARRACAVAGAAVVALASGLGALRADDPAGPTVRVAAVGWASEQGAARGLGSSQAVLDELIAPAVAEAARAGAVLVVTPEVGLSVETGADDPLLVQAGELARRHGVTLALGYFDHGAQKNRIAFFTAEGGRVAEYEKTHLIMTVETYRRGSGALVDVPLAGGGRLGGMICQDDNFTDLGRGYGVRRTPIVAVPTWDWQQVAGYHFENSRFRAVENDYAIVRAAKNGISAIVSPRGHVLAERDHHREGAGVIVADVPLGGRGTPFSRLGSWIPVVWALLLLAALRRSPVHRSADAV